MNRLLLAVLRFDQLIVAQCRLFLYCGIHLKSAVTITSPRADSSVLIEHASWLCRHWLVRPTFSSRCQFTTTTSRVSIADSPRPEAVSRRLNALRLRCLLWSSQICVRPFQSIPDFHSMRLILRDLNCRLMNWDALRTGHGRHGLIDPPPVVARPRQPSHCCLHGSEAILEIHVARQPRVSKPSNWAMRQRHCQQISRRGRWSCRRWWLMYSQTRRTMLGDVIHRGMRG